MMRYKILCSSVTGYRKLQRGKVCEDSVRVMRVKDKASVISVADGHGDERCIYAHVGSSLATRAACEVLREYVKNVSSDPSEYWNSARRDIAVRIIKYFAYLAVSDFSLRCKDRISDGELEELISFIEEQYVRRDGRFSQAEIREMYLRKQRLSDRLSEIIYLYGTTVRASVIADSYIFSLALGDGDTMVLVDGKAEWILPKSEAFECETESLSSEISTLADSFVFSYVETGNSGSLSRNETTPELIVISSDGFRNSFFSDSSLSAKLKQISDSLKSKGARSVSHSMKPLLSRLTRESVFGDDITVVLAWI